MMAPEWTAEDLVRSTLGTPLERCVLELERYDADGCCAHVGVDRREVVVRSDSVAVPGGATIEVGLGARVPIAALRFVAVRVDRRGDDVGLRLVDEALLCARHDGFQFAGVFTGGAGSRQEFFERLNFVAVRPRLMVAQLGRLKWPEGLEDSIEEEW